MWLLIFQIIGTRPRAIHPLQPQTEEAVLRLRGGGASKVNSGWGAPHHDESDINPDNSETDIASEFEGLNSETDTAPEV